MKEVKFTWYVLNYNPNKKQVEPFDIFQNIHVNEWANKLCHDYKTKHMTFKDFVSELDHIISWQEWGRVEYEISVCEPFCENLDNLEKIDCYYQAHPNITLIAKYVLEKYYPHLKIDFKECENV